MILEFKTARDKYGNRKYLCIDTGAELFSRNCRHMVAEGIEIKPRDYKELLARLAGTGFKEVEFVY